MSSTVERRFTLFFGRGTAEESFLKNLRALRVHFDSNEVPLVGAHRLTAIGQESSSPRIECFYALEARRLNITIQSGDRVQIAADGLALVPGTLGTVQSVEGSNCVFHSDGGHTFTTRREYLRIMGTEHLPVFPPGVTGDVAGIQTGASAFIHDHAPGLGVIAATTICSRPGLIAWIRRYGTLTADGDAGLNRYIDRLAFHIVDRMASMEARRTIAPRVTLPPTPEVAPETPPEGLTLEEAWAQMRAAQRAHRAIQDVHRKDIASIGKILGQEAINRRWCGEYEQVVQKVNAETSLPLPPRPVQVNHVITAEGQVTLTFRYNISRPGIAGAPPTDEEIRALISRELSTTRAIGSRTEASFVGGIEAVTYTMEERR